MLFPGHRRKQGRTLPVTWTCHRGDAHREHAQHFLNAPEAHRDSDKIFTVRVPIFAETPRRRRQQINKNGFN